MKISAVLFDADGVLTLPEEYSQDKVDTARTVGIQAHLYQSVDHVKEVLSGWAG